METQIYGISVPTSTTTATATTAASAKIIEKEEEKESVPRAKFASLPQMKDQSQRGRGNKKRRR